MARLVYSLGVSLDGYIEDPDGNIASVPGEDMHRIANEQAREAQALLYGRRMFELMEPYWTDVAGRQDEVPDVEAEFARAYVETPRIVFSDTLETVPDGVRLVRSADAHDEVERLKERPGGHLDLGGAELAASLFDLVDEVAMWVSPVVVGGGKRFFPEVRAEFTFVEARPLDGGLLYVRYER
ncbi:MAG TPA: dihydrofolate reductase family protein [Solirubrobacteraceae bacterium]|jgi:dihydrofolate reductase